MVKSQNDGNGGHKYSFEIAPTVNFIVKLLSIIISVIVIYNYTFGEIFDDLESSQGILREAIISNNKMLEAHDLSIISINKSVEKHDKRIIDLYKEVGK